ncbi:MAG: PilZ domain-containing protein [Amphritea sp.]
MQQERRRFSRIHFDAKTEVRTAEHTWPVQLIDISLKGIFAQTDKVLPLTTGTDVIIDIHLAGNDIVITMPATLMHHHNQYLGFQAGKIDIDSISHLRRLVELNLGDEQLLERELEHLITV